MNSDDSNAGPTKKRRRGSSRSQMTKWALPHQRFLSGHADLAPILVLVTPLRHKQGQILERNLRDAGADVLSENQHDRSSTQFQLASKILVVTDNAEKARERIAHGNFVQCEAIYISVKWASAILGAKTWMSYDRYILSPPKASSASSNIPTDVDVARTSIPKASSDISVNSLPVWCQKTAEACDMSQKSKILTNLPSFPCQRCTITQAIYPCPNKELCDMLELIANKRKLEKAGGDDHTADIRGRAYLRASSALKCVPFKLVTSHDAQSLSSFGPRVLAVAHEYLTTGKVAEAELVKTDPRLSTMSSFKQLYGIGYTSARAFYDDWGLKSVETLLEAVHREPQKFSDVLVRYLEHYEGLHRMTRQNAEEFKEAVEVVANAYGDSNLHLRFVLCGGFRRGEASGHDVDLLYCRRREQDHDHSSVMEELVSRLERKGLIRCVLRLASDAHGWGEVHYFDKTSEAMFPYAHDVMHGIAEFKGQKFRLDIVGVRDASEFCYATLAWSGSTLFQRDMRSWCETKKQWSFGQHGLFHRGSGARVELDPVPKSEMDVFAATGLTYRPPYERSC